jgi:hypothetical protein
MALATVFSMIVEHENTRTYRTSSSSANSSEHHASGFQGRAPGPVTLSLALCLALLVLLIPNSRIPLQLPNATITSRARQPERELKRMYED